MDALVCRVVVGDIGGVPQFSGPRQEHLRAQFRQDARADERGYELLLDQAAKRAATRSILAAQVDQGTGPTVSSGPATYKRDDLGGPA